MTSTLQQIKENALWVTERFARESGLEQFAYTAESVHFLEQFLIRQEAEVRSTPLSVNKYVHLLGAYLGECIIACYGGEWNRDAEGMAVIIHTPTGVRQFYPFERVYERITEGADQSLSHYFSTFIPRSLSEV